MIENYIVGCMDRVPYRDQISGMAMSYWTVIDDKVYTLTFDIDDNINTIIDDIYIAYKYTIPNRMIYIIEDVGYVVIAPPLLIKKYILSLLPRVTPEFERFINDNKLHDKGYRLFMD
jgi:hypothetical protein